MTQESQQAGFRDALADKAGAVNDMLTQLLDERVDIHPRLREALRYTLAAPGKRIRAAVVLWCCELVSGEVTDEACIAAAAVEMVHTYSLVHDDLPAMDDDDIRRGQPTVHKAFDEATAILAGDALLTMAFELLASRIEDPATAVRMIRTLAEAAGPAGMIAGQMADMEGQNGRGSLALLRQIHVNKTARMFAASAALGGLAGRANDSMLESLLQYGLKIGLGFQIRDDILDVSASSEHLGKTAGKDVEQGKMTYPAVVGMDESCRMAEQIADEAVQALNRFDGRADILRRLATELLSRSR